ncbi:hypothetical protein TRIP_B180034 [uncultured Desulfatiglans sp.]|uniref:Uncharacterized protein n=1 Tax=Uncultured Desulfatiglans sp. TaxID=1748965 RepID=A0A653A1C5_UNCDX|nr:hypothetical protein TRIP_B180034 [uncultured Desulfatiglans sp.]
MIRQVQGQVQHFLKKSDLSPADLKRLTLWQYIIRYRVVTRLLVRLVQAGKLRFDR